MLRRCERDATPGFLLSLLCIVEQKAVPAEGRLMAAVVAKNTVGSSLDKTLRNRDWLRIAPDERAAVRAKLAHLLFTQGEEDKRVGTQLALLVANIARFDFPAEWPDLFEQAMAAAKWHVPPPPPTPIAGAVASSPGGAAAPTVVQTPLRAKRQALITASG